MEGASQVVRRSRRQNRRPALSDDYIDDIDSEIVAIESMNPAPLLQSLPPVSHLRGAYEDEQPRKRGRPRKHPPVPPSTGANQVIKRPRGRPRGSGKHQKAAAAAMGQSSMTGGASDSAATSGMASHMSIVHGATNAPATTSKVMDHLAAASMIATKSPATVDAEMTDARGVSPELWMSNKQAALPNEFVAMTPQGSHIKDEETHEAGIYMGSKDDKQVVSPLLAGKTRSTPIAPSRTTRAAVTPQPGADESAGIMAETPTSRSSRNRRKGIRPRKTE